MPGLGFLLTMVLNNSILLLRFLNTRNDHHFQTVNMNSSSLSFSLVLVSHSLLRFLLLSRYPISYKGIPALLVLAFMALQMILFQSLATILQLTFLITISINLYGQLNRVHPLLLSPHSSMTFKNAFSIIVYSRAFAMPFVMLVVQVLVSKCTLWSSTMTLRDRGWSHFLSSHSGKWID